MGVNNVLGEQRRKIDLDWEPKKTSCKRGFHLDLGGYLKSLVLLGKEEEYSRYKEDTVNKWEKAREEPQVFHHVLLDREMWEREEGSGRRKEGRGVIQEWLSERSCSMVPQRTTFSKACMTIVYCLNETCENVGSTDNSTAAKGCLGA